MMSLLDIRRAILDSQPAAVNRLARSLLGAFRREAGADGDWRDVARRHLRSMAAGALLEECALGEERAMRFVATVLAPVARLAPLYRAAGEAELAELADLVAGFGSERLGTDALRHAALNAGEAALEALARSRETAAGSLSDRAADRDGKVALRRFFSVAAPGLRFQMAADASRWIVSQGAALPLPTLAWTPYEEMLAREMDLFRDLVSGYLQETWLRDGRSAGLLATVPPACLAVLGPAFAEDRGKAVHEGRMLRSIAVALLVPALERLDQLGDDGEEGDAERTVAEIGRRIADWSGKILAADMPNDITQPRRASLETLRARHAAELDALLTDLRGRCADAARAV